MLSRSFIPAALTVAIALSCNADALMGQQPPAPSQPPAAQQQVEVTDELLERFVTVYPRVLEASQQAQAELATADDPAQAQAIQARAEDTIMAVLAEEEMSTAEYQTVVYVLRDDEALRARFMQMLQAAAEDPDA